MTVVVEGTEEISSEARHAARQLELRADAPDELDLLESSWKSTVLRATWRAPRRWGVVLKRCDAGRAEAEAAVYAEVLPRIPVRAPRLFGIWRDEDSTWLALEDLGDEAPALEDDGQRAMVSCWLGGLHAGSRDLTYLRQPADRGTRHYAGLLESARRRLVERRDEALAGDDAGLLERAIGTCDSLRLRWDAVEAQAALLPLAFVHADVAPENLRLVRSAGRPGVTAIDWEKAGVGTPLADLAMVDPHIYADAAGVPPATVSASMWMARLLAALSHNWAVKPMQEVERYGRRLERALEAIGEH